ncbi:MAG: CHC2 zinc finger domain-containing protein [Acidobacteriota bacterium]
MAAGTVTVSAADVERYVRAHIPKAKRQGHEWRAPCPIHKGQRDSFAVNAEDGAWFCHSQCGRGGSLFDLEMELTGCDFKAAAERITGRAPGNGSGQRVVGAYDYTDEAGALLYQVVRFEPKDFRQRRPDGKGGWIWNLDGARRVLYRLPEALRARAVFVVEGERDVDSLGKLGLAATTNPGGAGKWRPEYAEHFRGKRVAVLPDADEPGRRHALQVTESLLPVAASVRVVELPRGKDATEFLRMPGGTRETLLELAQRAAPLDAAGLAALRARWFPVARVEVEAGELEPEESEPEAPTVPALVWHGLAQGFVDLLEDSTEAPREYRLAVFLTVVGALIGRRAWVTYSRPVYPNFYTLLVGETATPRKTTVTSFGLDLMMDVAERSGVKAKPLYGLASVEGLAAAMKDGDSPEPYRVVTVEDELKSLLRKAEQKGVSNLIPRLTELYNCGRRFEVNTKADRVSIENPFLVVVAGSTAEWFRECIGQSEISGGFLNRWCVFTGTPDRLIPFPKAPGVQEWGALVSDLARVLRQAEGEFKFTPEAEEIFTEFYGSFRRRGYGGLKAEATARTDLHAVKFGLLYAILGEHQRIEGEDIARGIALAKYTMEAAGSLVGEAGMSRTGAQEKKLLTLLQRGRVSTREAMRQLHLCADELTRITRALERVGLLEIVTETTRAGRRRVFLEAR